MTTRLGIQYQHPTFSPNTNMDPNTAAIINTLIENFDDIKNFMKAMNERIVVLEEVRQKQPELESLQLLIGQRGRNLKLDWPIEARPHHIKFDQDKHILRNVKVEVSSFDGCLDSREYLDWKLGMGYYFGWYEISEARKVRFARMKLVRQV